MLAHDPAPFGVVLDSPAAILLPLRLNSRLDAMTLQLPAEVEPTTTSDRATPTITVLDLFAGAGGLTAGLHSASDRFEVKRAVELDTAAAASFAATFGEDLVYRGGIEDWLREEDGPNVDVVVGGPPCQGFSMLGKRDAEDKRNYLWQEYAATILKAQPKYFVVENVAAFAKSQQFRDFTESTQSDGILRDYTFEWDILNAADFGAFQARKRAILIGRHRDLPGLGMPEPTHVGRHRTVRQAFMSIVPTVTETRLDNRTKTFFGVGLPGAFRPFELHIGREYTEISKLRFPEIPEGGNRFDLPDRLKAPCWIGHTSGSGDVMGRLHWDKPSVTIRTEFFKPEKGRYLHPTEHRAITHYEAAVLQGFPATHRFVGTKTAIARQIGNAVPVPLGAAVGQRIADVL